MARKGKVIWDGAWLINVLFFDCASVLSKSVAKVTFSLAYVLNVAFVALYHKNEIGRRAGDVMSYTSLFIGREKSVRRGSHCNERTRLAPILWQRKAPGAGGRGLGLAYGVWPWPVCHVWEEQSTVAILGFQFGLYHVVVPLSFLCSIGVASLFSC